MYDFIYISPWKYKYDQTVVEYESVQSIGIFTDTKTYSKKVTDTVSNKNESGKKITSQKESPEVPEKPK